MLRLVNNLIVNHNNCYSYHKNIRKFRQHSRIIGIGIIQLHKFYKLISILPN